MILFANDWLTQAAKPDFTTRNTSWLDYAGLLDKMGVKNCLFHLAIHDQGLIGIDPHRTDLPTDIRTRIALECAINPWYTAREVFRVPAGSGAEAEPIRANRAFISAYWLFFNHITNIIIQPRQTGKSFVADCIKVELMNFRAKDTLLNLFTKDEGLRKENIDKIKAIFDALPPYLDLRNKTDSNNSEYITVNALGNKLYTHLPRSDPRNAEKVGRGFTSPVHFYDELPFQSWCSISYPASLAAMSNAIDRAKRANSDYGVLITTTAGKKDDRDGKFVYNKLCSTACIWNEALYDLPDQPTLEATIIKNTTDGTPTVYSVFNHRQLGYTDAWLRERIANSKGTPDEAARDFLCKWTSGTGTSPFTPKQADSIRAGEAEVKYLQITDIGYILRWYVEEQNLASYMASNKFVLGLDTSEATGGDDIGFYLINTSTARVVCSAKINETNIITFSQWLADFLCQYTNVTLIPERRSTGGTIIDYLLRILPTKNEDPFTRIFNLVVHDADLDSERYNEIRQGSRRNPDTLIRYRKLFGYSTSGAGQTSRSKLYSDTLFLILRKLDGRFEDSDVINQLLGLEYRNGRIDHGTEGHDDMVVAMLLAYWLVLFGKQLNHYGLNGSHLFNELEDFSNLSKADLLRNREQALFRDQLKQLSEVYKQERDPYKLTRIETQMRLIERKLVLESNELLTVDSLLTKLKEEKHKESVSRHRQPIRPSRLIGGGVYTGNTTSSYDYFNR